MEGLANEIREPILHREDFIEHFPIQYEMIQDGGCTFEE